LNDMAMMMLKRFLYLAEGEGLLTGEIPDTVVGIAPSGVPLATLIAAEEGLKLAVYLPAKHSRSEAPTGSLAGTFATITAQRCIIVDDVVTTGTTLAEVIAFLRRHGATPMAVWSLFDKLGAREVDGVPVLSLFTISRLG
ncbi:MAG TPA: orotate phosphoribosyltransferase-like protein, partial [Methanoculleus sp.]|nr:orotate phosphoribosyltransferase-like protein [Methanoculleus sp.]